MASFSVLLWHTRPNFMLIIGLLTILFSFYYLLHDVVVPSRHAKIMIGREGDFTWRYRLWDWLNTNGVSVKFVGPYVGTQELSADPKPHPTGPGALTTGIKIPTVSQMGGYNSTISFGSPFYEYGRNHFAAWGRQIAEDIGLIQSTVAKHQPDYLLVELGFNDIAWFATDAFGTLLNLVTFINNARAAQPSLAFAIANIPHRSLIGGREDLIANTDNYNAALPSLLKTMSTPKSPIYLVQFRENYDCNPKECRAAYDGLHPNALGEYQIAKAFADTLKNDFGWPGAAFTIPNDFHL
ncbi:hypothetical protein PT974_01715 [Cladobotryum mycophilum]|uniref:SGNH hydrolase-type esterase domain-containing protein n=1 Tax=Cladobotryum mycophilum TaxID=491253 RepID=A0ABR0SXC3_9HYPO